MEIIARLVVGGSLAVIADELEAAKHLTNGEEAEAFSSDNAASDELGVADVAGLLDNALRRLEECAVLERPPQGLVNILEGGH